MAQPDRDNRDLFAGIDWASKTHMVCVIDSIGKITVRFEIANTGKTFTGLVKQLTKLGVAAWRSSAATGRWSRHCSTRRCESW